MTSSTFEPGLPTNASAWDVVVIGAGVAGGVAACCCGAAGMRTLLVDRSTMPRSKVCGCCIGPAGCEALESVGLSRALEGAAVLTDLDLWYEERRVGVRLPPYRVLSRSILDSRLIQLAESRGVTFLPACSAQAGSDGLVRLTHAGRTWTIESRVVLACDGLGGTSVKDHPMFSWKVATRSRLGVGTTLAHEPFPLEKGRLAMLCGPTGYLGICRLPDGAIHAAAAVDPVALRAARSPHAFFESVLEGVGADVSALDGGVWKGTPLLTRRRNRVVAGNVLIVGDCAGYVEPFTGEGMTWAIRGAIAASDVASAVVHGNGDAGAWSTRYCQLIGLRHKACRIVASLLRQPLVMRSIVRSGRVASPMMSKLAEFMSRASPVPAGRDFAVGTL